jgi:Polyketide cyclase / dehydrase and lipid transport
MAEGRAEAKVAASPQEIWALVGDFGGLADWMPGMDACELDGDVRKIRTMGLEIHEQLKERDDDARRISYSIVKSPMPLEHHLATITVAEDGGGSFVTWAYEIRPDEMVGAFAPVYDGSVQAIKARFES